MTDKNEKQATNETLPISDNDLAKSTTQEIAQKPDDFPGMTKKAWRKRNAKMYSIVTFLYGLLCSTLPIVVLEIIWDEVVKHIGVSKEALGYQIFTDFFRAGLIEEGFKFLGFFLAFRRFKFKRQAEAMFAAGLVGLVYGIVEKAAFFNLTAFIIGIALPMHFMWQLNQGRHFFAFCEAKAQGKKGVAARELFLATGFLYVFHSVWDTLLDLYEYFSKQSELPKHDLISGLIFGGTLALGVAYVVFTIVKTVKTAKKAKRELHFLPEENS